MAQSAFSYEALPSHGELPQEKLPPRLAGRPRPNRILAANVFLFLSSVLCLALAVFIGHKPRSMSGQELLRQTTFFSPLIDTMSPTFTTKKFTTYPMESNMSILRQPPSPAVDAYWDRISSLGMMPITEKDIRNLEKDPSTVIKAPTEWNLGQEAYLVQLDGLHLLHCLNSMRESLHYNFAYYYPRGHSSGYISHISHCQEALARWLMCHPSMDLIKFDWVEYHDRPFPDFDINRKCIDFEALLDWQEEHRLPEEWLLSEWKTMKKPDDVIRKKSPPLNDESQPGNWVSLRDSFRGTGMPACESWNEE